MKDTRFKIHPDIGVIVMAYVAFIALGMPDGLLGVAWPSIRSDFSVEMDAMGALLLSVMCGYLASSFASGIVISRFGVGTVLAASCALTGAALVCYTLLPSWWMMVTLGVAAGIGAGAIDSGLNAYVASRFHEGLMQWLHASYGIGVTIGPVLMTFALSSWNSWRPGYDAVGGFQLALAACFVLTLPLWNRKIASDSPVHPEKITDHKTPFVATLREPRVWLSALLFFMYTGAEASLGAWAYTLLTESRGVEHATAGFWTGSYWAMFTVGRIVAGLFAKRVGGDTLVQGSLAGGLAGSMLLWWNPSYIVNLVAVGMIGFSIAPVFPGMVSGTIRRVGASHATNAMGMQMAAGGLGIAVIPGAVGVLARNVSLEIIPVCLVVLFVLLSAAYKVSVKAKGDRDSVGIR